MIITVTLNPALDKTATIMPLVAGGLNRIQKSQLDAGGKGINVSKLIANLGGESLATGFVGGSTGDALVSMLEQLSLKHNFVQVQGNTRINLKLLDEKHGITEVNDPGIAVTKDEENILLETLSAYAKEHAHSIFILAGSMHAGAEPDFYKKLTQSLKAQGGKVFVDADGEAFAKALEAAPDFVKPNKEELLQYFYKDSTQGVHPQDVSTEDVSTENVSTENVSTEELIDLCKQLVQEKGVGIVALSLGHEGAIFVTATQCIVAPALKVKTSSTVGAGDSMVGAVAYAVEQGYTLEDTVRLAVASSAGAVTTEGTKAPTLELILSLREQVTFEYK